MGIMHITISFLLPLLWVTGLTTAFVYIFKKRFNFQQLLPIALMSSVLLVYFVTMVFHDITISIWLLAIIAGSSIPLIILDKQRKKTLLWNVVTPGFVTFGLLYVFLYIINFNKVIPLLSDSSMHWAPHVWTMWLRDDFYTSPGLSIVNHGDYPPALQLFELVWMKLAGIWHEGFLFLALEIFGFSLIFPVIGKLTWKNKKANILIIVALFLIMLIILPLLIPVSYFYNNIEIDTVLAMIFAYGVYLALTISKEISKLGLIKLSTLITFLCITKQIALIFAGIILLTFIGNIWLTSKLGIGETVERTIQYIKNYRQNWRSIVLIFILLLLPVISLKLWSLQTTGYKSPDKGIAVFHLGLKEIQQIPGIILGHAGSPSQQAYPTNLAKHLIQDPAGFLLNFFSGISYLQFFLLMIAFVIFVGYKYKDALLRQRLSLTTGILILGWALYLIAILGTFLVGGMKDVERNSMLTSDRYLRTYIFAVLVILIMWIVSWAISKLNSRIVIGWTLCTLVLLGMLINIRDISKSRIYEPTIHSYNSELLSYKATGYLKDLSRKSGGSFNNTQNILVTEKTRDPSFHYLQYVALPNRVSILTEGMLTNKSLCKILESYDYLVIDYKTQGTESIQRCLNTTDIKSGVYEKSAFKLD